MRPQPQNPQVRCKTPGQIAPGAVVRFKLTATLSSGSYAAANPVVWDRATSAYITLTSVTLQVYDAFSIFSGSSGDQGYAHYLADRGVLEIIQMVC